MRSQHKVVGNVVPYAPISSSGTGHATVSLKMILITRVLNRNEKEELSGAKKLDNLTYISVTRTKTDFLFALSLSMTILKFETTP